MPGRESGQMGGEEEEEADKAALCRAASRGGKGGHGKGPAGARWGGQAGSFRPCGPQSRVHKIVHWGEGRKYFLYC